MSKISVLKSKIKSRNGLTLFTWAIGLILIIVLGVLSALFDRKSMLALLIVIVFILSFCALVTMFARYVDLERFPASAFFNIGFIYLYSFMSIGMLAVDLSFSLYNRSRNDEEQQAKDESVLRIVWNVIYWGSMVHGSILSNFFSKYWTSGHFSMGRRIKHAFKQLLILIIVGIVVLGIVAALAYFLIGLANLEGIKSALMIMANVYSMLVLVVLLAYGLFNLPVFLWKYPDNKHRLFQLLEQAEQTRKEYRGALVDFHTKVSQCKNLIANHKSEKNATYMDILSKELPEKDLEGQNIAHSTYFTFENLKKGQEASEDLIASIRYQFTLAFFMYKRKKGKWLTLFNQLDSLVEKPVEYQEKHLRQNNQEIQQLVESGNLSLENLLLKPRPNKMKDLVIYRLLATLILGFCLFVLVTEGTVIVSPEYSLVYLIIMNNQESTLMIVAFTIGFLSFITLVCFFTIFNRKVSDYLQLVPGNTDCITFSSITAMCCKIITVGCFNYMTIIGEIRANEAASTYSTSYVDFYSSMIKVKFIGEYFNTIMPLFILIFGIIFALLSMMKMQNRAIQAFKKIGKSKEEKEKLDEESKKQASKKDKKIDQSKALVEQIIRGERAIIAEYEQVKKREDRNKMLRFNQPVATAQSSVVQPTETMSKKSKKKSLAKTGSILDDKKVSLIEIDNASSINKNSESDEDTSGDIEEYKKPKILSTKDKFKKQQLYEANENPVKPITKGKKGGLFKKASGFDDFDPNQLLSDDFQQIQEPKKKMNEQKALVQQAFRKVSDDVPFRQDSSSSVGSNGDNGFDSQTSSIVSKGSKFKKDIKKEGYLMKKKSKTLFGISQQTKRYAVLENDKLTLYEDHSKKSSRKTIDMSQVKVVCFHYDEKAPVKSKKLSKKDKDESRFDIYTPSRTYMMNTDGNSLIEAESWVRVLKQAAQRYNPNYGQ